MDPERSAAMGAHVVFFAAAALFVAAQSARLPHAGDAWQALPGVEPYAASSAACGPGFDAAGTYLDRLGATLWQADGASFVGEYVAGCER